MILIYGNLDAMQRSPCIVPWTLWSRKPVRVIVNAVQGIRDGYSVFPIPGRETEPISVEKHVLNTYRREPELNTGGYVTPLSVVEVQTWLNDVFVNNWIGRYGPCRWPPRSPNLALLDFFLWGFIKYLVFPKDNRSVL
ncbi:hypothetical protein EVAR_6845_1 [Eumeta japonica]|uniref:Uncharacterized protein n=1 Tax=Eumeta variegata TaxID=151549 RepID=A0A4C1U676_EUMVA|nr:hypothetical protein EVAR_6845_1 [Eumeta japonica]